MVSKLLAMHFLCCRLVQDTRCTVTTILQVRDRKMRYICSLRLNPVLVEVAVVGKSYCDAYPAAARCFAGCIGQRERRKLPLLSSLPESSPHHCRETPHPVVGCVGVHV